MKIAKTFLALILLFNANLLIALPTTDIAIFDLKQLFSKSKDEPQEIFHITYRDGYDNQPKFSADGKTIYFTRGITDKSGKSQTDIMAYDFESKRLINVSNSKDSSEYSPTPYQDGALTIIGVADNNGKQYLNQLDINTGAQKTFTTALEPIGYHAWLNKKEAAVFVLGDVMTLQVLHTDANRKPMVLAENIGRSFHRLDENQVSYTVEEKGKHRIYILDGTHESKDTGIVLPEGVQDYVWFNNKEVIFGKGSKLYRINSKSASEIADLSEFGIKGISRLALGKIDGSLALVYSR